MRFVSFFFGCVTALLFARIIDITVRSCVGKMNGNHLFTHHLEKGT